MVGSYAAGQALLIVAITVVPVCLTVIALVLLVDPRDRVQAIRELAPALLFTRFRRRWAEDDAGPGLTSRPMGAVAQDDDLDVKINMSVNDP
jgi:hypothetical protein